MDHVPNPADPMLLIPGPHFVSRSIERQIGETVADAISCALTEYLEGSVRAETKVRFGDLIVRLYEMWQHTAGYISFDDAARIYGKIVLRERFGDASDAALDELISWLLRVWAKALRQVLH
jgi:hypothetical protein